MWKRATPWGLVVLRAMLAPMVVWAAWQLVHPGPWLGIMIALACVSDIYDGVLARRWGTVTPGLRRADTIADTAFYLAVLAAVMMRHWPAIRGRIGLLAVLLSLEALRLAFDWMKFHRMASYHTYTAKVWGLLLAIATIALLCFNRAPWLVTIALAWGILCDLEGLAISALLPNWAHDVKTIARAMELRKKMQLAA